MKMWWTTLRHTTEAHDTHNQDRVYESRKRGSSADSHHSNTNRVGTSTSMSRKKAAKTSPEVGELLHELLMENRRRARETEEKVNYNPFNDNLNCTFKCHVS